MRRFQCRLYVYNIYTRRRQRVKAKVVERTYHDTPCAIPDAGVQALLHLPPGPPCKGTEANAVGGNALVEEVLHPGGDDTGFAWASRR